MKGTLKSRFPVAILRDFGLEPGGFFRVTIFDSVSDEILIGLCTETEMGTVWSPSYSYDEYCRSPDHTLVAQNSTVLTNETVTVEFTAATKDIFTPIFIMCDVNYTEVEYEALFSNPDSFLDWRDFSVLVGTAIDLIGSLFLFFVVLISLFCKSSVFMRFHLYLLSAIFIGVLGDIFQLLSLSSQMEAPELCDLLYVDHACKSLRRAMVFTTLILAAAGWQIHTSRFPILSFLVSFVCGLLNHSIDILRLFYAAAFAYVVDYLLKLVVLMLVGKLMFGELRVCERYLLSYKMVVNAVGIDAQTTPIRKRALMQYVFLCVAWFFFISQMAFIHIIFYFDVSPGFTASLSKILDAIVMILLSINYLPCQFRKEDWAASFNHEHYANCSMEEFNAEAFTRHETLVPWTPGMELPLPPMMAALDFSLARERERDEVDAELFVESEL
jgi:hypothetical protein